MKTKILAVMIALLSLSLLVLGCDTATNSDSGGGASNWPPATTPGGGGSSGGSSVQDAKNLAAALGGTAVGKAVFLPAGATIPAGAPVTVPAGVTLQPEGALTIAGTLNLEGDLKVDPAGLTVTGTLNAAGNVTVPATATVDLAASAVVTVTGDFNVAGIFTTAAGSAIDVDSGTLTFEAGATGGVAGLLGTITVGPDGTLQDLKTGGNSLWPSGGTNTGSYVYSGGATAILGGGSGPVIRLGPIGSGATVELEDGATLTQTINTYTFTGNVTIAKSYGVVDTTIQLGVNTILTIDVPGTDENVYLLVGSTGSKIEGTVAGGADTASKIVIVPQGGVPFDNTIQVLGTSVYNFYDTNVLNDGVYGAGKAVPVGEYEWIDDVNGDLTAGDFGWDKL
jgi:hypothetical protein